MSAVDPRVRLMELVDDQGVSLSGLSALIGRNPSYLQQFVRKGSPRKLEEGDRRTLARFFGVDEVELGAAGEVGSRVGGEAPGRATAGAAHPAYTRQRKPPAEWADVPRLPLGASAGPGAVPEGELPVGQLRFSARWLKANGLDAAMLSAIEVEGDSMDPTLRDGDEILVDLTPRPLRSGIHVLRLDDVLLVKRVERAGDTLRLISDNRAYPEIERAIGEVEIVGRVVWKGGRL